MSTRVLKLAALGGVVAFVTLLWPVLMQGETTLKVGYLGISSAMIGVAALALFSGRRWMMWAALGVWPGALLGGLAFAGIAFLTVRDGATGWEGVIAVIIVVMGIFAGGVAGAIAGGVLGARRSRRAGPTDRG